MAGHFSDYEFRVIQEIALHQVKPGAIQQALELAGYPFDKAMKFLESQNTKLTKALTNAIHSAVHAGLEATVSLALMSGDRSAVFEDFSKAGQIVTDWVDLRAVSLDLKDAVAGDFNLSNAVILTLEGTFLGAATTLAEATGPFAIPLVTSLVAADVTASMTLLSRQSCQIAASYGYNPHDPMNVPHILASLAPIDSTSDDGFLAMKGAVFAEVRAAQKYLATIGKEAAEKAAPKLIQALIQVVERFGMAATEKELVILLPVAGAALNGAVNLAFQQVGKTTAQDYFRIRVLIDQYGEDVVLAALEEERRKLLAQKRP